MQDKEQALSADLTSARNRVDAALLDSINLSGTMDALFDLVRSANRYMDEREASAETDKGMCTRQCWPCHASWHAALKLTCDMSLEDIRVKIWPECALAFIASLGS